MKKRTKITSTFTIYPADHNDVHWWEVGNECTLGACTGVRITYREPDRQKGRSKFEDQSTRSVPMGHDCN